jgi:hypothetical protein
MEVDDNNNSNNNNSAMNLQTCSAQDLATALVTQRGQEAAVELLQQAVKLSRQYGNDNNSGAETRPAADLGDTLLTQPFESSMVTPRLGKVSIQLHQKGLVATRTTDQTKFVVTSKHVTHVLVFSKPEDCKILVQQGLSNDAKQKKLSGCLVLLSLKQAVEIPNKNKTISCTQICFSLPAEKKTGPVGPALKDGTGSADGVTERWCQVLETCLCIVTHVRPGGTGGAFTSFQPPGTSTTDGGMPYVNCYMGVNDGVLYPLSEGLLFYKPPRFLPRSQLESIACGRGNQSSGRYVDMIVQTRHDHQTETMEFTNIRREENGVLNDYIHKVLVPAMQADANNAKSGGDDHASNDNNSDVAEAVAEAVDGDDNDDDTEDEDVEATGHGVVEDDEDEEDEDFAEDEDDTDGSDSGSDDDEGEDEFEVVRDEFANELVKEKRKNQEDGSATESEDDGDKPRVSKRLRKQGA